MRHRSNHRSPLAVVSVALLAVACQAGGTTTSVEATPTARAASTPRSSVGTSVAPSSPAAQPPDASIAVDGGDPVVGQLGSFTWLDGGSDSPWLPGAPIEIGAGEPLTVTLGDGVNVVDWTARRVPAGTTDGTGVALLGEGGPPVAFAAPGPGAWSTQVTIRFADDIGSATYYWQLTVR